MTISTQLRNMLNKPVVIGGKTVRNRLLISPMAGFTHIAFRELISLYGGYGLLFTEMCSAKSIPLENPKHSLVFRWRREELSHLVCQIFGSEPRVMADAARRIEDCGFFGVDINFGCSVAAVCKRNAGAALLKTPDQAIAIVSAVRSAVSIPVSVKFRTGWSNDPAPAVELARRFEDAGVDALTFHPRVAPDRRTRPPRWEHIGMVVRAVNIPVFGNGDVFDAADAVRMLAETGCDGISIGRIALSNPWTPAMWLNGLAVDNQTVYLCARRMLDMMLRHFEPVTALRRFRKWAVFFAAGFKYGLRFSAQVRGAKEIGEVYATIDEFFAQAPQRNSRPNMNLFR